MKERPDTFRSALVEQIPDEKAKRKDQKQKQCAPEANGEE
jgi:hypothetical protein